MVRFVSRLLCVDFMDCRLVPVDIRMNGGSKFIFLCFAFVRGGADFDDF